MKDIAIYGAGGFGKEIACLVNLINRNKSTWNIIGFFDDNDLLKGQMISHYGKCIGNIDDLNAYDRELYVIIAIGNPKVTRLIVGKITNPLIKFPNIIHPNVKCADEKTFNIGMGNIIQGGCFFSCDVTIGNFNILNGCVFLGHDDNVGSYNVFMPRVDVSGSVKIGDGNFFGVNSVVLQQLKIGDNIRLGAGSVLMFKPKDGELYIGNPAKRMKF